jgi:acyl transferase domain-containing protein
LYLSPFIFTPGFTPAKKPICQVLAMLFCWHVPQQWEYFYHRNQSTKIDLHTRKIKKQRYTVLNLLSDIETELTHWKVRPFADSVGHVWRCDSFQELA